MISKTPSPQQYKQLQDNILPGDSVSMVDSNGGGGGGMPRPPPVRGASVFRDHRVLHSMMQPPLRRQRVMSDPALASAASADASRWERKNLES